MVSCRFFLNQSMDIKYIMYPEVPSCSASVWEARCKAMVIESVERMARAWSKGGHSMLSQSAFNRFWKLHILPVSSTFQVCLKMFETLPSPSKSYLIGRSQTLCSFVAVAFRCSVWTPRHSMVSWWCSSSGSCSGSGRLAAGWMSCVRMNQGNLSYLLGYTCFLKGEYGYNHSIP